MHRSVDEDANSASERQRLHDLVEHVPDESVGLVVELLSRFSAAGNAVHRSPFDEAKLESCPQLSRVSRYVRANYASEISVERAAQEAGLERKYFSTFFRKKVGICFRHWVTFVRVGRARQLLGERRLSISQIAFDTGFQDLRTFERAFQRFTGVSAATLRKRDW